jgi:uncharacterized protein (UPF0332 family)
VSPVPAHANDSWQKAEAHLGEALAQGADASPMAIIHSSYYAMFHAARAVLFQIVGEAPKTQDQTIQQFGLLVRDLDDSLLSAGKAFNEVKDERNEADYDVTIIPSADEARGALVAAVGFLDLCGSRYGFRPAQSGKAGS